MTEPFFLSTTRTAYDTMAAGYAERFQDELAGQPLERGLIAAFAELVGDGRVADVGSGTSLRAAGFAVQARLLRERGEGELPPRAFLLARVSR